MAERKTKQQIGFGFNPTESTHHFVVILPAEGTADPVLIEERFTYGDVADNRVPEARARIDSYTWGRIAAEVQGHFNRRLKDAGKGTSAFRLGENLLAPYLGKELTVLLWALDGVDPTDLPNALANWLGFVPEERWWLYTTVKASGAGPDDRDRGWRKAIRWAFAENPAPPPADARGGVVAETPTHLSVQVDDSSDSTEDSDKPVTHKRGQKSQGPTLPLFE